MAVVYSTQCKGDTVIALVTLVIDAHLKAMVPIATSILILNVAHLARAPLCVPTGSSLLTYGLHSAHLWAPLCSPMGSTLLT